MAIGGKGELKESGIPEAKEGTVEREGEQSTSLSVPESSKTKIEN